MKKAVIKDNRTGSIYFDDVNMIRVFEIVLEESLTLEEAKKKYPEIIDLSEQKE